MASRSAIRRGKTFAAGRRRKVFLRCAPRCLAFQPQFVYLRSVKKSSIIVREEGTEATIIVIPPAEENLSESLRTAFSDLLSKQIQQITVDLEGIHIIHTTVLGSLVFAYRNLHKTGGRLKLLHVSPPLREILSNLSLDKLVDIA
jgi:anti-anti-sigma factor